MTPSNRWCGLALKRSAFTREPLRGSLHYAIDGAGERIGIGSALMLQLMTSMMGTKVVEMLGISPHAFH